MTPFQFEINQNVVNFSLFDALKNAGWQGQPASVTIINHASISSASALKPAFDASGLATDCELLIINQGEILGAGGNGGNATAHWTGYTYSGSENFPNEIGFIGEAGRPGGAALILSCPTRIKNTGKIWGGGGGGGAGMTYVNTNTDLPWVNYPGHPGGGGAGNTPGIGGSPVYFNELIQMGSTGNSGSVTAGGSGIASSGALGTSGAGGNYGEKGQDAPYESRFIGDLPLPLGGAAGHSIMNTHFITSFTGDNADSIKGPRI